MSRRKLPHLSLALFLASTILTTAAQNTARVCPAPPAILASTQPNIFSEQQEQWLGDAMADMLERDYKPVQDPAENEYLARITKRLLAALPPTTIQFRVILVDSPEVNGFSLAGGRVYLTRKLVANANSEDEVASVIAHEMGHILSHQFAIETTADLKRLLNITSVGDKADIYAKFQRLLDASMKDKHPSRSGNSDEGQDEADTVAVYAAAAAGYRPQAYAEFWDRMFFVEGKVGGPLSDLFGITKPEQKRLRAILKLVNALPAGCGAAQSSTSPEFEHWRSLVIANQPANSALDFKPIGEVVLNPPLRMDLEQLRFSRDGNFILAQDETSISVLSREPYKQLFRFDAEDALPAEFSPDSKRIVFHTPGLHTEEWSVADQKLVASHEPISRNDCIQSKFAPDGRTLFCISLREEDPGVYLDLAVLEAATGSVIFQKKGFFEPSIFFLFRLALGEQSSIPLDLMPGSFSADGNTLLIGPADAKLAFDLRTRQPIPIGKDLKNTVTGAYAFLGSDKVVGVADSLKDSGIFSFPEGKRLQPIPFRLTDLESVTRGNYVLSYNIADYAIGLADLSTSRFIIGSKAPAMDVWDNWLLNENGDGTVLLHNLTDKSVADFKIPLPLSPLGPSLIAYSSPDGKFLALSARTRGGVWNLVTGQRVLLSRRFTSAVFAADDTLYVQFPKDGKQDHAITHLSLNPVSSSPVPYKEDDSLFLSAGLLQEWKPGAKKAVELIVHNVADNSILWRRTFNGGEPARTNNLLPGQTILSFPFKTDFAKDHLKSTPALADRASAIKNKDAGRLIQVLDNANGNVLHELVLEVPLTYEGVRGINVVGDNLYLSSDDNRTMAYALSTGAQLRQFFGYVIALDPSSSRICMVNRRDEAVVYDPEGHQIASFHTGSPLRFAAFQNNGTRLILLTADQKVRTMDISAPVAH
jgi:hypothetical protein